MMIKEEFTCQRKELSWRKEEDKERKEMKFRRLMESPELSLGPSGFVVAERTDNQPPTLAPDISRKRKISWDHLKSGPMIQTSVELQLKDPLPTDWEQCLDLESGRMYYMNRNTLKMSWNCPKEQKLDLDLNISALSHSNGRSSKVIEDPKKDSNSSTNMVAVACLKCHLLVMLHRSSPSCPNCKYLHYFPTRQNPHPNAATKKSMETLSLLN